MKKRIIFVAALLTLFLVTGGMATIMFNGMNKSNIKPSKEVRIETEDSFTKTEDLKETVKEKVGCVVEGKDVGETKGGSTIVRETPGEDVVLKDTEDEATESIDITVKAGVNVNIPVFEVIQPGGSVNESNSFNVQTDNSVEFTDLVQTVTKENPMVIFSVPAKSKNSMKWKVIDKEEVLFESGVLAPGELEEWDAFQVLETGQYKFIVEISLFTGEKEITGKGGNTIITLSVE